MDETPGKLTVDEFLRLATGIVQLVVGTTLTKADQAKLDAINARLDANDPSVNQALTQNNP